jgi:hypothetical protein
MADYHLLSGSDDGRRFTVAFHVDVPDEQNEVQSSGLRAAIAADPDREAASIIPGLPAAEQTKLDNGEMVEHVEVVHTHPGRTMAAKKTALDAYVPSVQTKVLAALRLKYAYFGFDATMSLPS